MFLLSDLPTRYAYSMAIGCYTSVVNYIVVIVILLVQLSVATQLLDQDPMYADQIHQLKASIRDRIMDSRRHITSSNHSLVMSLEYKQRLISLYRQKMQQLQQQMEIDEASEDGDTHVYRQCHTLPLKVTKKGDTVRIAVEEDFRYARGLRDTHKHIDVYSAALVLHRMSIQQDMQPTGDINQALLVYQSMPDNRTRLINSQVISLNDVDKPVTIDIKAAVESWSRQPHDDQHISISSVGDGLEANLIIADNQVSGSISTLELCTTAKMYGDDGGNRRKRATDEVDEKKSKRRHSRNKNRKRKKKKQDGSSCTSGKKCCRHAVEITYADLGIDTDGIHEPGASFTAYICLGKCTRNYKISNFFADMKNRLYSVTKDRRFRNTCAPVSFVKNYPVLYFDPATQLLTYRYYDDFIVKECGCT